LIAIILNIERRMTMTTKMETIRKKKMMMMMMMMGMI
jgi:hypothetical protein